MKLSGVSSKTITKSNLRSFACRGGFVAPQGEEVLLTPRSVVVAGELKDCDRSLDFLAVDGLQKIPIED